MTVFYAHLRTATDTRRDEIGIEFVDLDAAYLDVCKAIPDSARDLLREGKDPMACAYAIHDEAGRLLMDVPFTDVLSSGEAILHRARSGVSLN